MTHSENIISSVLLPDGKTYEICDAQAIHSIEDLGLSGALRFMGVKKSEAEVLALTSAKVGDVWLVDPDENVVDGVNAIQVEYVCVQAISGTANANAWEKLGNVHDAASSTHKHSVTVTGTNEASEVTGKVTVPTVSKTQKYMTASAGTPSVTPTTDSVLGAATKFTVSGGAASTTKLSATGSGVAVGANGTAEAITGFGTHTTAAAITALNTVTPTAVSIPNVTGNTNVTASKVTAESKTATKISSYGKLPTWTPTVNSGVLSFTWDAGTLASGSDVTAHAVSITDVTATNTTLGTALVASKVGTDGKTAVATGSKTTANAITALGTPTTATALTGVKVTAQPTITLKSGTTGDVTVATGVSAVTVAADNSDRIDAVTSVAVGAPAITLTNNASNVTGAVPVVSEVTIGSTSVNLQEGSAAAQKWTQSDVTVGTPQ